jgi:hypothetical protein
MGFILETVHSAFQIVRAMGYQGANGFDVADGHGSMANHLCCDVKDPF